MREGVYEMVTMKDIAEEAGVSRGTVDRVLNNRGRVAPDKEMRIREIAEKLGYQPNPAGRRLAARKKQLKIGFIYLENVGAPFHAAVYRAAREYAAELEQYGVEVLFFPVVRAAESIDGWIGGLEKMIPVQPKIDGWAAVGLVADALENLLKKRGEETVPIVSYNLDSACAWKLAYVGCDYRQSGRLACGVASLMTNGKGKVCILSMDKGNIQSSMERIEGFEDEMKSRYPEMEIVDKLFFGLSGYYGPIEKTLVRKLEEYSCIDIIYLVNPGDYSICEYISETEMPHKAKIITNDLITGEQREMVRNEKIAVTICQEPEKQGRKPLEILFDYLALGKQPDTAWYKTELSINIAQNL